MEKHWLSMLLTKQSLCKRDSANRPGGLVVAVLFLMCISLKILFGLL